jgi:hypothetical protein
MKGNTFTGLGIDPFSHPKTMFLPSPGNEAIIVTRAGSRFRSRRKRFGDPHAALNWCIANDAALVFWKALASASN